MKEQHSLTTEHHDGSRSSYRQKPTDMTIEDWKLTV